MHDEDRIGHDHAGRHVDEDGVGQEGVVEADQGVAAHLDAPTISGPGHVVARPPNGEAALRPPNAEESGYAVVHHHLARAGPEGDGHQLGEDPPCLRQGPGRP